MGMSVRSRGCIGAALIVAMAATSGCAASSSSRGTNGMPRNETAARNTGTPGAAHRDSSQTTVAATPGQGALETLRASMAAGDPAALAVLAVALVPAAGAREMTGELALDERVDRATIVTRSPDGAAVLLVTTCGNATLGTLGWDGSAWRESAHTALIGGMRPGRCAQTTVRAESMALTSDARREVAVVFVSQDATGESVRGPFLSVFHLGDAAALATMLTEAAFGSVDDETGATTQGEYAVIEDVPPPRDLHIAIRPGSRGPGGAPLAEINRRRYALRGARLEMVQQTTERAE